MAGSNLTRRSIHQGIQAPAAPIFFFDRSLSSLAGFSRLMPSTHQMLKGSLMNVIQSVMSAMPAVAYPLWRVLSALLGLFWITQALAAADPATPARGIVEGNASFRERIALPPQAQFEATLEDTSLADAPAREIGRVVRAGVTGSPIPFSIAYDPARIEPSHTYTVRARIRVDGALWFTSDRMHRVLTRGGGNTVEIPLKRVQTGSARPAPASASPLKLPATFTGDLPCADCPGIRYHLDVWPDRVYHLRREWLDRHHTQDELGRWMIASPGRILRLHSGSGAESALSFAILDDSRLRLLDTGGQAIDSRLPYDLNGGPLQPTELTLPLAGEMTYLADAGRFRECLTERDYPIAQEADARALEQAYLRQANRPGAPLYVTLEGTLAQRPKADGGGQETSLVVKRFIGAWPNQSCGRGKADTALVNTYWRIVRLDGQPIAAAPGRREPHLLLKNADGKATYSATVGCNTLLGGYSRQGDALRFTGSASTMMACPPELRQREQALASALARTTQWLGQGQTLQFRDAQGHETAAFEAVHF